MSSDYPQKRLSALGTFIMVAIWAWTIIYLIFAFQPQYAAKAMVLIKDSALTSHYVTPDQYYAESTTSSSATNPVLNTMGLLKSQNIGDALYVYFSKHDPETLKKRGIKSAQDWQQFYGDGKKLIKAKNEPGTDLISVQFYWPEAKQAQAGLNVVLNAFQKGSLNINQQEQRNRSRYLQTQVAKVEKDLEKVRAEKSAYKMQVQTGNLAASSENLIKAQVEVANSLSAIRAEASGRNAAFQRYQKMLGMSPETALDATALGLNETLMKLQSDYYQQAKAVAALKATYTDKNPKVKEAMAQLQETEADIKAEAQNVLGKDTTKDPKSIRVSDKTRGDIVGAMVTAQADAIRLNAESNALNERLNQLQGKIEALPTIEERLNQLEDEERSLSGALASLRQKAMEADLKMAETVSNVFIVDAPQQPYSQAFPTGLHVLVMGLALGLAAGLGVTWLQKPATQNALANAPIKQVPQVQTTEQTQTETIQLEKRQTPFIIEEIPQAQPTVDAEFGFAPYLNGEQPMPATRVLSTTESYLQRLHMDALNKQLQHKQFADATIKAEPSLNDIYPTVSFQAS